MNTTIDFDTAIELFEITDIDSFTKDQLKTNVRQLKKRWHPDSIANLNDEALTKRYKEKFQLISPAEKLLLAYLNGTYHVGEKFHEEASTVSKEPFEVIRENAAAMQTKLSSLWQLVKDKRFKHTVEEEVLSDGFVLKDLLTMDFKDDIAMLSVISFAVYNNTFGLLTILLLIFKPVLGMIAGLFWVTYLLFCFLGFLPLSRFWLPKVLHPVMYWFIDFGLGIYNWLSRSFPSSLMVQLYLKFTKLIAQLFKYLLLFPLYEVAKLLVGNKVVGVVKKSSHFYADASEWYIDSLLKKEPLEMQEQELYHLSHVYGELLEVQYAD